MTLAKLSEIDVSIEGVKGAKNFFEAKVWCGTEGHEELCTQALIASETVTPLAFQQKILKSYWKRISCGCVFPAPTLMLPNPATAFPFSLPLQISQH